MNTYRVAQDVRSGRLTPDEAVVHVLSSAERDHRDALDEVVLLATYLGELLQAPPNPAERTSDALSSPERDLGGDGGHHLAIPDTAPTGSEEKTTTEERCAGSWSKTPDLVHTDSIETGTSTNPVGAAKGAGLCPHGMQSVNSCWRCCQALDALEKTICRFDDKEDIL